MIAKICVTGLQGKGKLRQPELHVGAIFIHGCGVYCNRKKLIHQVLYVESAVPSFSLGHVMAGNQRNMHFMMAFSSGQKISLLFEMSDVHAHICAQCLGNRSQVYWTYIHNNSIIISFALTYFCSRSVVAALLRTP